MCDDLFINVYVTCIYAKYNTISSTVYNHPCVFAKALQSCLTLRPYGP